MITGKWIECCAGLEELSGDLKLLGRNCCLLNQMCLCNFTFPFKATLLKTVPSLLKVLLLHEHFAKLLPVFMGILCDVVLPQVEILEDLQFVLASPQILSYNVNG